MQVTLENTSDLERSMKIVVPAEELETQVEEKVKQAASQAQIKGFRPGKVPLKEIRRRYGEGIRQEVGSELMQSSLGKAIQDEKVQPAGMPEIKDIVLDSGKDLEFTAIFEVFPEVQLTDFSGIEVEKPLSSISEADMEKMIETLKQQKTKFVEVERKAKAGDKVNIDYEGLIDGEAFAGNKAEGADLVLDSGTMIPGFEEGLIGSKTGEVKDIPVKFPDDYQGKEVAGKDAIFHVTVNNLKEPQSPDLNDEFFAEFGVKEGGLAAFKEEVRSNMTKELESAVKVRIKNQVMETLLRLNSLVVPKALIQGEVDRLRHDAVHQFGGHGKIDPSMLPAEMFEKKAEKSVKLGLLMKEVVDAEKIEVDEKRVRETIENMATSYQEPEQLIEYYYSNEQQLSQIRNMVLEDQVIDTIMEKARVTEVKMDYEETIKIPAEETEETEKTESETKQTEQVEETEKSEKSEK